MNPKPGWFARQILSVAKAVAEWPPWMRREAGLSPQPKKPTHELLGEYTAILNRFGHDSPQEREWLQRHAGDDELIDLCETAYWLKRALCNE